MKNNTKKSLIFFILFVLLIYPSVCAKGVLLGIDILFYSLIPALLPFLLFSNYLIITNTSYIISDFFHPLFHKIFKTGKSGSYALLMGFLCGYPLGSKILCDLLKRKCISRKEANYLFKFINNPSPAFLQGYLFTLFNLSLRQRIILMIFTYLPSIIIGIYLASDFKSDIICVNDSEIKLPISKIIDDSVSNAFLTITKIAGYLIIFSIISVFIQKITILPETIKCIILCMLEVTSGTHYLSVLTIPNSIKILFAIIFSIIGGLSIIFQINGVSSDSNLKISELIKYKIISALFFTILFFSIYKLIFI